MKAYDAKTGKLAWIFHTLPRPGTAGAKTWSSDPELKDGGGGVWTNPVVDPKLGLVYFPTGNPWPDFGGRGPGDEDYLDGVIALDLKTGKLKWFYQTTHHDEWDYDCAQPPLLWEQKIKGKDVKGLSIGCKNGYVYELNRETGKPVTPVKEEAALERQDRSRSEGARRKDGLEQANGEPLTEPIPVSNGEVTPHCASKNLLPPEAPDGKGFEYACAYMYYGTDHYTAGWNEASLDWQPVELQPGSRLHLLLLERRRPRGQTEELHRGGVRKRESLPRAGKQRRKAIEPRGGWLTALDLEDNGVAWQNKFPTGTECDAGSSTTAGGLLFMSDSTGKLRAFDAKSGKEIWSYQHKGLELRAPSIAYEVDGTEYVTVVGTLEGKAVLLGFSLGAKEPSALAPKTEGGAIDAQEVFTDQLRHLPHA